MVNWSTIFDEAKPAPGATDEEIARFVGAIREPLTPGEIDEINDSQRNPFPPSHPLHANYRPFDPAKWIMPAKPLPASYLDFLRWSNGGWCRSGEREFGFFPTHAPRRDIRSMTLAYHLPEYMPGALPFAFDGGGTFYLFDMREDARAGEFPIVCSHSGCLGWAADESWVIADSFEAACRGKINVDDVRLGRSPKNDAEPPERIDVYVVCVPKGGVQRLRSAINHVGVTLPIKELPAILKKVPYRLCHDVPYLPAARLVSELQDDDPCLGVFAVDRPDLPVSFPPWEWK